MAQRFPPADEPCFIDANTLYYSEVYFPGKSEYCTHMVKEIRASERRAATLSGSVADAVHKVMFSEIVEYHKRDRAGLLAWVKKHPEAIKPLSKFPAAAARFAALPITWLPTNNDLIIRGVKLAVRQGLTVNDALIVAAMEIHGIRHLVTNDDDFDGVPGITVWKPQ